MLPGRLHLFAFLTVLLLNFQYINCHDINHPEREPNDKRHPSISLQSFAMDFGKLMANVGGALDEFGKNQLGPAMAEAGKRIGPAMAEAGKQVDDFGRTKFIPAMLETGKHLDEFGRTKFIPAVVQTGKQLNQFNKNQLGPAILDAAGKFQTGMKQVGPAIVAFDSSKLGPALQGVARNSAKWIEANPGQTALNAALFAPVLLPGLAISPFAWAFGISAQGPVAGKLLSVFLLVASESQ